MQGIEVEDARQVIAENRRQAQVRAGGEDESLAVHLQQLARRGDRDGAVGVDAECCGPGVGIDDHGPVIGMVLVADVEYGYLDDTTPWRSDARSGRQSRGGTEVADRAEVAAAQRPRSQEPALPEPRHLPLGGKAEQAQWIVAAGAVGSGWCAAQRLAGGGVAAALPAGSVAADAGTRPMESKAPARAGVTVSERVGAHRKPCLRSTHI